MKSISKFLVVALTLVSVTPATAAVATTAGSNLTAFNGASGAMNNNTWNTMMNTRGQANTSAPRADFGNCNALILRCAQPKCASGGCTTMEIANPIVSGCVQSNATCKQYGDELVEYISAQLVASSTARANAQAAAAQTAAAQAAAQQTNEQLEQMQAQMQEMQASMERQNAETANTLRDALAKQQEMAATKAAGADAAPDPATTNDTPTLTPATDDDATDTDSQTITDGLTTAQKIAAKSGLSADLLAREQITGQIMSKIENAQTQLKALKAAMNDTFEYAGCDTSGNNCAGPKRVKTFKQRAMNFFEPYNAVLDELYDALIMAQSVGVDITDIYMMLNGTCNAWAKYLCTQDQVMHYTNQNCKDGISVSTYEVYVVGNKDKNEPGYNYVKQTGVHGGAKCTIGQVVPMSDGGCQLIQMLTSNDEVQYNWLYPDEGFENAQVRIGCASEALESSALFRNRKKQASIDIETLQRIIEQDAPSVYGSSRLRSNTKPDPDGVKYCAVNADTLVDLQKSANLKKLPSKICTTDADLLAKLNENPGVTSGATTEIDNRIKTLGLGDSSLVFNCNGVKKCELCQTTGGTWYWTGECRCKYFNKFDDKTGCNLYSTSSLKPIESIETK